ncbi:MAG: hypothetical protein JWN39_525, partial [Ilumatobacteraceae bacterium]|nr:hypothetical protein [Ilumatobacteraceae bacterium]
APPELHAVRLTSDGSPFAGGRATFLTTYVLGGDPQIAFDAMSVELPKLYETNRMTFPAAKKVVREGDVFAGTAALGRPALQLTPREVPFVGHTGVIVVQRRSADGRAAAIAELDGVTGVWTMESRNRPGLFLDMIFVEDDPAGRAVAIRTAVPHTTDVLLDAPYLLIDPMRYPWADSIRNSDLPATIK